MIAKVLIIAESWIGYVLDGSKTWEMRSSGASHRGWFGLIRKGTGAIYGIARLVDVGAPLSPEQMVRIDWGGPEPIVTDLDGSKKLFRARGWIGIFFKLNRATAGDRVIVEQYRYTAYFRKAVSQGRAA